MKRVVISRRILDRLVRAKVGQLDECSGVQPLPVVMKPRANDSCNWAIPGWTGDGDRVGRCKDKMRNYLEFLQAQFDIAEG